MFSQKNLFIFVLMSLALVTRLIPHPVNFTPVLAVGLFAGLVFKNNKTALIPILLSLFLTDLILGFHSTSLYVYFAGACMPFIATALSKSKYVVFSTLTSSFLGSVLFFVVTNFGVWATTAIYEHSLQGLMACFVVGLPFFHNTLVSTLIYLPLLILGHKCFEAYLNKQPQAATVKTK